jgi:two-component system cell cycle sensor histidine kinase/response regulator CckA
VIRLPVANLRVRLTLLVFIALLPALAVSAFLDGGVARFPADSADGGGAVPRTMVTVGLASALALAATWIGGDRLVRRPIDRMLAALREAAGTGQAEPRKGREELRELAASIEELTGTLEGWRLERERLERELRRLEQRLIEAHRIEAVGRLAGGVVHDFNNLLTVILGRTELLRAELEADPRLARDVELISMTGQRARALSLQLLAFSRRQHVDPKVVDLGQALLGMSGMLQRLVGDAVDLSIYLETGLGCVKVDQPQIEQVILNLAVNARDAMPDGGQLTIQCRNVVLEDDVLTRCPGARRGPHVLIEVVDTGHGMDERTRARIFEPFFSTKAPSKGTGLGLATVLGVVEQHGGSITVDSEPGRGSMFRIYLPQTDEPVEVLLEPATADPEPAAASDTILVVDDEDVVRTLAAHILRMKGYSVLEAPNGCQALRLAERTAGPIHLLLTDVVMPQMQGPELANRLRLIRPETRVMYMSGYAFDVVPTWTLASVDGFLPKPFTPETLARMVREILGRGSPADLGTTAG